MKRIISEYDEYTDSWFVREVEESEIMYKFYEWLAYKLPTRLVYFCYIRFMAFVTTRDEGEKLSPDEMTFSLANDIWQRYNK